MRDLTRLQIYYMIIYSYNNIGETMNSDTMLAMKADVYKAMGEPYRLSIMQLLHERGELCVCEIIRELEAEQSNISKHLSVLRNANVVAVRKEGTKVFYKLTCPCLIDSDACLERTLIKHMEKQYAALTGNRP